MDNCSHKAEKQQRSESFIVLGSPSLASVYCNINALGLRFYDCVSIKAQVTGRALTVNVISSLGLDDCLYSDEIKSGNVFAGKKNKQSSPEEKMSRQYYCGPETTTKTKLIQRHSQTAPCMTSQRAGVISEEYKRLDSEITKCFFFS